MQRISIPIKGVLWAALLTAFFPVVARGAPLPVECRFEPLLAELQAFQSSPESPSRAVSELDIRKNLLFNINLCGLREVKDFIQSLSAVSGEQDIERAKSSFSRQLANIINSYTRWGTAIGDAENARRSKELAREYRVWRIQHYVPVAERIAHFIVWDKNQALFRAGQERFSHISRTIIDLGLSAHPAIASLLREAELNLIEVDRANELAKKVFIHPELPDDSLKLMQDSLQKLAAAYRNFFDVSEAMQNIIPHY